MKATLALLACFSLGLSACTGFKDQTPASGGGSLIPESLKPRAILSGPELTSANKEELKSYFNTTPNASSISDMLEADKSESENHKKKREEKIKALSGEAKSLYDLMKANCTASTDEEVITDSKYEKTGDVSERKSTVSLNGNSCPLNKNNESHQKTVVLESNLEQLNREYEANKDPNVFDKYKVVLQVDFDGTNKTEMGLGLQKQIGLVSTSMEFTGHGAFETGGKNSNSHMIFKANIEGVRVDGRISGTMDIEALKLNGVSNSDITVRLTLNDGTPVALQIRNEGKETIVYLNGQQISTEELSDLFSSDFNNFNDNE
jgi:hypothetical protein